MHAGSGTIHAGFPHCGEAMGSSPSPAMPPELIDADPARDSAVDSLAAPSVSAAPRLPLRLLIFLLVGSVLVSWGRSFLSGVPFATDAWRLPLSGAAATLLILGLAKPFDLIIRMAEGRRS